MLKMIRNAIVGMMNALRMVMSLHPRAAAREPGSSVARTATDTPLKSWSQRTGEVAPRPRACRVGRLAVAQRLVPVGDQAVERFLGRPFTRRDERVQAVVHLEQHVGEYRVGPEVLDDLHRVGE